jgi:hypothetical protein
MNLVHLNESFLQLDYENDPQEFDQQRYFEEDGSQPFNAKSPKEMIVMLNVIGRDLRLDEYALKKLEIFLRSELPFFAVNRRLVRQWVSENFLF